MESLRTLFRIKNHLRAAKQRNGLACLAVRDYRIPHLSGPAHMYCLGRAFDGAVARSAEVIGLELDGGETGCAFRKIGETAVSRGRIGEGNDASCMQKAVGRHDTFLDGQFGPYLCLADVRDDHTDMAWQIFRKALVELFWSKHGGRRVLTNSGLGTMTVRQV